MSRTQDVSKISILFILPGNKVVALDRKCIKGHMKSVASIYADEFLCCVDCPNDCSYHV